MWTTLIVLSDKTYVDDLEWVDNPRVLDPHYFYLE